MHYLHQMFNKFSAQVKGKAPSIAELGFGGLMTQPEWKKVALQKQKMKKSEGKMLYHCNLICVSLKHGIHESLRCLKIVYIHNC